MNKANTTNSNQYVNPIALKHIGWKYYIVYCIWILVEIATVYFLFPETHGRTLEELSFMFEGKDIQKKVEKNVEEVLHTVDAAEVPTKEQVVSKV